MLPECCLKIDLVYLGVEYSLDLTPVYSESGELLYYTFNLFYSNPPLEYELTFNLLYSEGVWIINNLDNTTTYYSTENVNCPIGSSTNWEYLVPFDPIFERFFISWDGCPNVPPVCCMFINIQFNNIWRYLPVNPVYNEQNELLYYEISFFFDTPLGPVEMNLTLGYANGIWYLLDYENNVYYTLETTGCPSSSIEDWQCIGEPLFNDFEILNTDCHQEVPECCLSISTIFEGETITADLAPVYDEGDVLLYYEFVSFEPFRLYYSGGVWYMTEGEILYYSLNLAGCPGSTNDEWQEYTPFFDAFVIFSLDCKNEPDEQEFIDIPEKPDLYYCKHKNLMRKVRAGLADRGADMKDIERFGLDKCMDKWEDIIKDYLIVHALQCAPYNEYTGLDEKCLIGKLTDKFNC